jgi:acetyl esterase/lipase
MKRVTRRGFVRSAGSVAAITAVGPGLRGAAAQSGAEEISVERDVVFARGGEADLRLDIYHPPSGPRKRMATIHLHGGGFDRGSKRGVATSADAFARLGYVSIGAQYRLTGEAAWPAQIEDVKAAIRWTRAQADRLDIDADKIAVAGYSAGGLLALLAAGTADLEEFEGNGGNAGVSTRVAACVAYYPSTIPNERLVPATRSRAAFEGATPATHISPGFAPTMFMHGVEDTTISLEDSLGFFSRLREAGVPADLHLFQGAPHAFEVNNPDAALAAAQVADLFYERLVVNPREYPPFGGGRRGG